ncbi:hypothetical protein [Sphingobacterium detergens]|uniref:Uncharacterized protein n=1 Tax=Sphingobacterium detergens TaxID=1145106 RepID=A0A420AQW3_SPHD1|nr:hypothetical protein [Sphingobacterium detergens]RKE46848.1 hypothetical protein DFQ12_4004 [Sphingobacterium detergens]
MPLFQLSATGNPTVPADYSLNPSPSCASGTNQICSITANDDGTGKPVLTPALKDQMIVALHTRTSNPPTVSLRS